MTRRPTSRRSPLRSCHDAALLLSILLLALSAAPTTAGAEVEFERDIAPLLVRHCLECHNETGESGGLRLTSATGLQTGGDSGPVIDADAPEQSSLLQRVLDGEMPPAKGDVAQHLPDGELNLLRQWVLAGSPWPEGRALDPYERTTETRGGRDWWSLQPLVRPDVPVVGGEAARENPVDAFIRAGLKESGWVPAPEADRRTLLRRLSYDLVGLPPTAEEYAAFEQDQRGDAYERRVDQLLASPQFGERWGRYWLDLVRYADTCGYERDQEKTGVWKYRDWVIQALNDDMPYDRFVLAQLAGDELPDRDESTVIATGFIRLGTWNDEPNDPQAYKYERLEDMVHATSTAFLALTVKCARCHDHKFDPIPQTDYYRMASAFWAGFIEPRDRKHLGGPSTEELGSEVFGWTDQGREVPPLHLLWAGNPKRPGPIIEPGNLTAVSSFNTPVTLPPEHAPTTRRRLQLAQWITDPRNPLTARVLVNRLWLHHFGEGLVRTPNNFGFNGDLPTHPELLDWLADELMHPRGEERRAESKAPPATGQQPLAISQQPWTLKRLHKLIVMSDTYRQASNHSQHESYAAVDPANRLWWRSQRRRLDADALHDSLLAASGRLDLRQGGPGFKPSISPEALEGLSRKTGAWKASPPDEQRRRSIYTYLQRSFLPPFLTVFDQKDTTLPCGQRDVTTVAPQALSLLNNEFVHSQSRTLAARIAGECESDDERVRRAWRSIHARAPSDSELLASLSHLRTQQARFEKSTMPPAIDIAQIPVTDGLVLWLSADEGVERDADGRVQRWADQSGAGHHAGQKQAAARPQWVEVAANGQPALRFSGQRQWLAIGGQVLTSQPHTLFAIASDEGESGHREIFSNWDGAAGNASTSVFLGLTAESTVRFSDAFANAGTVIGRSHPFLLTAVTGADGAAVSQNGASLASRPTIPERVLTTPYVIGQQGNLDGEYWHGDIVTLLAYDRQLSDDERQTMERWLATTHGIEVNESERDSPNLMALASLCHVLLNANEFLYVD